MRLHTMQVAGPALAPAAVPPAVLVVGPLDDSLLSLLQILMRRGRGFVWHTTIRDAVDAAQHKPVSVAICERQLPDGDWRRFEQELGRVCPPPPLIVTSPVVDDRFRVEALSGGACDMLVQPYEAETVNRIIDRAWRNAGRDSMPRLQRRWGT